MTSGHEIEPGTSVRYVGAAQRPGHGAIGTYEQVPKRDVYSGVQSGGTVDLFVDHDGEGYEVEPDEVVPLDVREL